MKRELEGKLHVIQTDIEIMNFEKTRNHRTVLNKAAARYS